MYLSITISYMKKRAYAIEFLLIFLILILPPLIFNRQSVTSFYPVYHWSQFILFACAVFLSVHVSSEPPVSASDRHPQFLYPAVFLISFGSLCVISALVQLLSSLCGWDPKMTVLKPHGFLLWVNCIAGTIGAAFYEEVLFRQFLPDRLERLFEGRWKWIRFVWESELIVIFALSHHPAGCASVLNAFFAAIVLRLAFLKCRSIAVISASHGLYNLLSILVMILQASGEAAI